MATRADVEEGVKAALQSKPKMVSYPDYDTSQDFTGWLSGFAARVRLAHGFKLDEGKKVEDEIVRSIAGKLKVGTALNAYDRLEDADKKSYTSLVQKLTEEFVDPHEKRKFNECHDYNKRKKDQSLKDFMQGIIEDMNRYSCLPSEILTAVPAAGNVAATTKMIPNPEKEKQGVRRFRAGMRDQHGKKDKEMVRHLRYNLVEDAELTWKNAIKIASRWELSVSDSSASEKGEESSSDDDARVTEVKAKGKKVKSICTSGTISALHDQVHENQMKIAKIETAQERLATSVNEMKTSTDSSLKELHVKLDASLAQPKAGNQQPQFRPQQSYQQPYQQPYQPRPQAANQQQRGQQQGGQQQRGGFRGRPRQFTWSAQTQQQRQGNYGYDRRTPAAFTPAANSNQAPSKPATTAASVDVEEEEETLVGAEGGDEEDKVTISVTEFLSLADKAGVQCAEENLTQMVGDLNFI